jgi:hypothetical protein
MDISNMLKLLKEKKENTEKLPDLKMSKDDAGWANASSKSEFYQEFWSNLKSLFKTLKPEILLHDTMYPYCAINSNNDLIKKLNKMKIHFEFLFTSPSQDLSVGLHFENATNHDSNLINAKKLKKYENDMQKLFKEKVRFEQWGQNRSKIDIIYPKKINNLNELKNKEIQEWAVETMIKLYDFFIKNDKISSEIEEMIK